MLKLTDRIEVSFDNGLGIQLSEAEVKLMARIWLAYQEKKIAVIVKLLGELFSGKA